MILGATPTKQYRFGDLNEFMRSSTTTGSSSITLDNGELRVIKNAIGDNSYAYWTVYVPAGGIVEVSFEARNQNLSSKGTVSFTQYSGPEVTPGQSGSPNETFEIESTNWQPYNLTYDGSVIRPFMAIVLGMGSVGSVYFRNITISIYNTNNYSPEIRGCMLRYIKAQNSWIIDDAPGRFTNLGCTGLRKYGTEDGLELDFAPVESWQRPLGNAHMEYNSSTVKYTAKCSSVTRNRTFITVIDMSTGQAVKLNALPADAYIAVTVTAQ